MSLCVRFGDRLLMVNGQNFRSISRKKAAEVLRSCDQLSVTMEISRIISKLKPQAMVHQQPYMCTIIAFLSFYRKYIFVGRSRLVFNTRPDYLYLQSKKGALLQNIYYLETK